MSVPVIPCLWRGQCFSSGNEPERSPATPLLRHLVYKIKSTGPITVAEYMKEVLTNPAKVGMAWAGGSQGVVGQSVRAGSGENNGEVRPVEGGALSLLVFGSVFWVLSVIRLEVAGVSRLKPPHGFLTRMPNSDCLPFC